MEGKFFKRAESFLGTRYEVFGYRECPSKGWVEMNLRPLNKSYPLASACIDVGMMDRLSKLYGTSKVGATAYDISAKDDYSDHVLYLLIEDVKFPAGKK